jgi:ribosomal protein S12 methylthiotransferase accessory factor
MEWFQVREGLSQQLVRTARDVLGQSIRTNIPAPPWPLSPALTRVRDFLLREAYVLDIEERIVPNGLYYVALVANVNREATSGLFTAYPVFAHATDVSYEQAFSRAVGEFVERYSFLIYDETNLARCASLDWKTRGRVALDPVTFAWREAVGMFPPSTDFLWTEAVNLCTGAEVMVPAQLVFWNYDIEHRTWSEPLLRERNSCGLASGYTREVAIRSALYELIQRDAFFTHWFTRTSPRRIELDEEMSERFSKLVEWCRGRSITMYFMEVTADVEMPTVLCMLRSGADEEVLALGFGTSFDVHEALESALTEAVGLYRWTHTAQASGMQSESYAVRITDPHWKDRFSAKDRALMWSRPDMFEHMSFLVEGNPQRLSEMATKRGRVFASLSEELAYVGNLLAAHGSAYEPLVYTAHHRLPLSLSSVAVRVFVPALMPMYMEENGAVSPRPRLEKVCGPLPADFEHNPYPHPFP